MPMLLYRSTTCAVQGAAEMLKDATIVPGALQNSAGEGKPSGRSWIAWLAGTMTQCSWWESMNRSMQMLSRHLKKNAIAELVPAVSQDSVLGRKLQRLSRLHLATIFLYPRAQSHSVPNNYIEQVTMRSPWRRHTRQS